MPASVDKEKYFRILKANGLSEAITTLHGDLKDLEFDCFDGPGGFRAELWEQLEALRGFSKELWDFQLTQNPS